MKKLISLFLTAVSLLTLRALACAAEFGPQEMWPAVTAATDLRSFQYRVVRFAAAQTCSVASHALSAAATELPCGILQNNPNSGEVASIAYAGPSKAVAGATLTARALLTTNGSGQVIDAVSGSIVIGRAMEAVAVSERASVMLAFPMRAGSVA